VLAASLLVCWGFWCWASTILVPSNVVFVKTKRIPIGNNSDLYPRWLGAREALLHNRDPYNATVTREIQLGFYGRQIDPSNPVLLAHREETGKARLFSRALAKAPLVCLFWQWATAVILSL
jgi:hypothetical protein